MSMLASHTSMVSRIPLRRRFGWNICSAFFLGVIIPVSAVAQDALELRFVRPSHATPEGGRVVVLAGAGFADGMVVRFGEAESWRNAVIAGAAARIPSKKLWENSVVSAST